MPRGTGEKLSAAQLGRAPLTSFLGIHDVEGEQHGVGERGRLLLTGEVQAIDLAGVSPLVERWCRLIVLQPFHD